MFIIDHCYPLESLVYSNPGYNHGLSVGVATIYVHHAVLTINFPSVLASRGGETIVVMIAALPWADGNL